MSNPAHPSARWRIVNPNREPVFIRDEEGNSIILATPEVAPAVEALPEAYALLREYIHVVEGLVGPEPDRFMLAGASICDRARLLLKRIEEETL